MTAVYSIRGHRQRKKNHFFFLKTAYNFMMKKIVKMSSTGLCRPSWTFAKKRSWLRFCQSYLHTRISHGRQEFVEKRAYFSLKLWSFQQNSFILMTMYPNFIPMSIPTNIDSILFKRTLFPFSFSLSAFFCATYPQWTVQMEFDFQHARFFHPVRLVCHHSMSAAAVAAGTVVDLQIQHRHVIQCNNCVSQKPISIRIKPFLPSIQKHRTFWLSMIKHANC